MSVPASTAPGDTPHQENDADAKAWREAKELRQEYRGWIVVWLAAESEFRAYRRLPGTHRDTALHATTARDIAVQITEAEERQRSPRRATHG